MDKDIIKKINMAIAFATVEKNTKLSQEEIAKTIATISHDGQFRTKGEDNGLPYIVHPQRVAGSIENILAKKYGCFTDEDLGILKSVAWLHDTVEDTEITFDDLLDFGVNSFVIERLKFLTKKEGQNYFDFIMGIKNDNWARLVKIADINDNIKGLEEGSTKDKYRLARYILESNI